MSNRNRKVYNREYYLAHLEEITKSRKNYRLMHLKKIAERNRKWRLIHKKEISGYDKKYDALHKERAKVQRKEYYMLHFEKEKIHRKAYRMLYPEKIKEWIKRAQYKRRRSLGFIPLNKKFLDADSHHVDRDRVIYLPAELHRSVQHSVLHNRNMKVINKIAFNFLQGGGEKQNGENRRSIASTKNQYLPSWNRAV